MKKLQKLIEEMEKFEKFFESAKRVRIFIETSSFQGENILGVFGFVIKA